MLAWSRWIGLLVFEGKSIFLYITWSPIYFFFAKFELGRADIENGYLNLMIFLESTTIQELAKMPTLDGFLGFLKDNLKS